MWHEARGLASEIRKMRLSGDISARFEDASGCEFISSCCLDDAALESLLVSVEKCLDVTAPLKVELNVTRRPAASEANNRDSAAFARTELYHETKRERHPFQSTPMFFRRNGSSIDLINLYKDAGVFLVCNGPSLGEAERTVLRRRGIVTFGMNNGTHEFATNLWAAVDDPYRFMRSIWEDPTILKFIPFEHLEKHLWDERLRRFENRVAGDFPNVIGVRRSDRFNPETWLFEDTVNWGQDPNFGGPRSVMLFALRICHLLGFRRIYLVGCDFSMDRGNPYWFPEDCSKQYAEHNNDGFSKLRQFFELLRPIFDEVGFEVYNATPGSRLREFPFVALDEAIRKHAVCLSGSTRGMYSRSFDRQHRAEPGGSVQ
jgi:hypothetical protein